MTRSTDRRPSRFSRLVLGGCLLGVVVTASTTTAAHADGELGLSYDGVHWSDELTTPLFAADTLWVPGDVRSAHFFVRNQADELGRLSMAVQRAANRTLLTDGDVDIDVRAGDGAWAPVGTSGLAQIPGADDLASDEPVLVSVRVALDPESPNRSMMHATDLTFLVRVSDARVVAGASSESDQGGQEAQGQAAPFVTAAEPGRGATVAGGLLPATGSAIDEDLLWFALLLVGTGSFLVARRRRDDDEAHDG